MPRALPLSRPFKTQMPASTAAPWTTSQLRLIEIWNIKHTECVSPDGIVCRPSPLPLLTALAPHVTHSLSVTAGMETESNSSTVKAKPYNANKLNCLLFRCFKKLIHFLFPPHPKLHMLYAHVPSVVAIRWTPTHEGNLHVWTIGSLGLSRGISGMSCHLSQILYNGALTLLYSLPYACSFQHWLWVPATPHRASGYKKMEGRMDWWIPLTV